MAAGMHEIHKTTQNTRDQNKNLSVLWACAAPSLKTFHYKKQKALLLFSLGCSECCAKESLKGSRLQALLPFRSTPSLVTQSLREAAALPREPLSV